MRNRLPLESPERTWERLWRQYKIVDRPKHDYQSELVYSLLIREFNPCEGQLCLEGGSGSGCTSFKLTENGAETILLDTSKTAVKLSGNGRKENNSNFVVGSILRLPFRSSSLDFAWNAGVLEHFKAKEQQIAITEAIGALKSGRKLIVIVPNREAHFYNLFRTIRTKMKTWPFGYEEPLSNREFEKFSPKPAGFLSCGLLWQLVFCLQIPLFSRVLTFVLKKLLAIPFFEKVDKECPGYLLAAIFLKNTKTKKAKDWGADARISR